ncbi:hypothetical protein PFISCL1PPCAC_5885, partial [Pristionchus fissidentatus]
PHEKIEKRYIFEEIHTQNPRTEHLFILPQSISLRNLNNVFLSFFMRPVLPRKRLTVDIMARDIGSETFYNIGTKQMRSPSEVEHFKVELDIEVVKRWLDSSTPSVILSIVCHEVDSDFIIFHEDVDSHGRSILMEMEVVSPPQRKKRSHYDRMTCKVNEPNQECCPNSNVVTFASIGMDNVVSPTIVRLSWCAGICKLNQSFLALFSGITRKVMTDGKVDRCCHGIEYEHIDIMYVNEKKEVKSERIYDIVATDCACS